MPVFLLDVQNARPISLSNPRDAGVARMRKEYKKLRPKLFRWIQSAGGAATNGDRQELRCGDFDDIEALSITDDNFPTDDSSLMAAKALDAYIRFRAKHEGVGYQFSPKFFADHIEQGCEMFFGVTFQNGQLVDDEEQPELLRRWKELH
jgi:hypothetical protein